jgi:tetratricopeptide (TPR) repeat protein/transcriptional regulator with XRE-family HTH domain
MERGADPGLTFASLLRQLRVQAGLTQEQLAEAARISTRGVSDLERGGTRTAHNDTARLLAAALGLDEPGGERFVAAARGRLPAEEVLAVGAGVGPGSFSAAATRALPRDIASFTGRQAELGRLLASVEDLAASGGVVGIHAIDGMAGVGKTTFAVHAAHRLTENFPDGQFFLGLHAHTPGRQPVAPADALVSLLLTAGVTARQIPSGLEARAARWRDHIASKKILLLLDDATSHEQVRPLLPGTSGSLVLVTSRRRLTALQDTTVISLDTLTPEEAAILLVRLAGRPGPGTGDAAVDEITSLCGYLPLAVGMLAAQLRHHPTWTPAALAAELAQARDRLAVMRAENVSVAAAFDLSYQDLTARQQLLFRRLGLAPGPGIDARAAASLDETSLDEARAHLNDLYDQHLLTEPASGRYQLHNLLRAYAADLARTTDSDADRRAAVHRVLDYYLHTASAASSLLNPARPQLPLGSPEPGVTPEPLETVADALAWFEAERQVLIAAITHAADAGLDAHAWQLPWSVWLFFDREGYWHDQVAIQRIAIAAAARLGDRARQAHAYRDLGCTYGRLGQLAEARELCTQALDLHREVGDRMGEARAHNEIAMLAEQQGRIAEALGHAQLSLALYRDEGYEPGLAKMLNGVGWMHALLGDYEQALEFCEQALGMYRGRGDPLNEAATWDSLGYSLLHLGRLEEAISCLRTAVGLIEVLRTGYYQTTMLVHLGDAYYAAGQLPQARQSWQEALAILEDLNHSDTDQVRARLRGEVPPPTAA